MNITEEQLSLLSIEERKELKKKCIDSKDLDGLLTISIYRFKHGCMGTHEFDIPELAYLCGRVQDADIFNELMDQYLGPIASSYPIQIFDLSRKLFQIGCEYPNLSDSDLDFLESLYLDSKYYDLINSILFDKERLPRKLKHFDPSLLDVKHSDFSDDFLLQVYSYFAKNQTILDEEKEESVPMYFYNRPQNCIISKLLAKRSKGEFSIELRMHCKDFHDFIATNYSQELAESFAQNMNFVPGVSWKEFMKATYFWPRIENIEETARMLLENDHEIQKLRLLLASRFLEKCNSVKFKY